MYENIESLRPYFTSLREISGYVSLDVKIPTGWGYEHIIKSYQNITFRVQDKNEESTLLSLITISSKEGYDLSFGCANEIILVNKENEAKALLFEEKVNELKYLFQSQTLDKLRDINFIEEYGKNNTDGDGIVEQGNQEGGIGDFESEDVTD